MVINKWQRVFLITHTKKASLIFWLFPYAEQEDLITPVSLLEFAQRSWSYLVLCNYWGQRINFFLDISIKNLIFDFQKLPVICSSTQGEEAKPMKRFSPASLASKFLKEAKVPRLPGSDLPHHPWNWTPVSQLPGLFSSEDFVGINFIYQSNAYHLMMSFS